MTRQEELVQAARKAFPKMETAQFHFIYGAVWADARPINYDGKAMLYVNQRSHDNGYKEAVDKAVEWLEKNVADIWNSPCNPDKIVEQFRKAMKGD